MAKQNEVWKGIFSGVDLKKRIPQIVDEVSKKSGFAPDKLLSTSSWWSKSTGVGAFHIKGTFRNNLAILKIQGVKPTTSEVFMVEEFAKQNKSKVVRPPKVYANFPWDEEKGYEAFVLEDVGTNLVISPPTNEIAIDDFFKYHKEYRAKCRNSPWLEKPDIPVGKALKQRFDQWIETSKKIFPHHPLRHNGDEKLVRKAVEVLTKNPKWLVLEFMHGHFSARDLFKVNNQIVVLSNLYWSWRTPYYDLIFAYHWFMYDLAGVGEIEPDAVEAQRQIWLKKIEGVAEDKILLKYALLERAAAGLNLDALSVDIKKPIAKHIVGRTREITKELIKELS
ncbi:MAG: hypothetical protein QY322_03595 [bacterium]|nr:MAG: hypothetical protein QY322_03595 [bacterium]